MSNIINSDHPRLMEFYVENPNFKEPTAMQLFINIESEISYIMSINKSYSLLALNNGNKFVIYGNAKVLNTRYIYGLTRLLSGRNSDYFSDRLIRPSLSYYFDNMKFDLENIHLDAGQVFGILYSLNSDKAMSKFEKNDLSISHVFGNKKEYLKSKKAILQDRMNLGKELSNFANLDSFYNQSLQKPVVKQA